ncbi:MAG TPA: Ig-like domain repeat protein, partial [Verrucomicrobiae bacterium]|nr:Ig-like domain repeat protein [Verrucomicrobiae bacterium]
QFSIFFGDGSGGLFYTQPRINSSKVADGIAVDFDHNGTTDLVQARTPTGLAYFPGNGHGGFGDPITVSPSQDAILAVADLNGDGLPDLVMQDVITNAVSFFINNVAAPASMATSSTTAVTASPATGNTAAPVTLIATVNSLNAGSPSTGTVTFSEGATTLGSAPVNIYGIAALDFTFAAGLHNVNAAFNGVLDPSTNTQFAASSSTAPVAVFVNPGAPPAAVPNITLSTSLTPARQLNPVTLTANVTPSAPNASAPSGTVVFKADGDVLGSVALQGATATLPSNGLERLVFPTAGLHNVQAVYGGDATFPAATSATLVEDIRAFNAVRTATSVQLTLTPSTIAVNQLVTLHATVVGVANPPAQFIYRVNGDFLAFALQNPPFPAGFTPTAQGTYTISAEYPGDAVRAPSTASVTLVVGNPGGDFTVSASPSGATVKAGQSATFTITVNPVNGMSSAVNFSCSGLPAASSCTFSPASVTPGGSPASTTLTLNTTAPQSTAAPVARLHPGTFAWQIGIVFGLLLAGNVRARGKARHRWSVFAGLAFMLLTVSCGGGGTTKNPVIGTPPGTSTVTVSATSGVSHTAPLTLTVTP